MAIPRNLVYVFACVIVFAFLGMLYIVYTEKDLKSFLTYDINSGSNGGFTIKEDVVVHPLFWHLRNAVQTVDQVPSVKQEDMTTKKFYQEFLTNNLPFVMTDGAKSWPAIKKWKDLDYLGDNFGERSLLIIRVDRKNPKSKGSSNDVVFGRHNTMFDFANMTKHSVNTDDNFYFKNELLSAKALTDDIERPAFISKVIRPRFTGLTVWPTFSGRRPEVRDRERYFCVVRGREEFRLVSPVYKQNIYSGVLENLSPNESPVDFFAPMNVT
jgi:hypothetical protein